MLRNTHSLVFLRHYCRINRFQKDTM